MARGIFIVNSYEYDKENRAGGTEKHHAINKRIDAEYMTYLNGKWSLENVQVRTFTEDGETLEKYDNLPAPFITVEPSDFARIDIKPEEMNYFQLSDYIETIRHKGGDASEWVVDLYLKISFPLVSFVIVFFGAPMVAGSTKRGKAASFGLALVICFIYYSLINGCQILGRNEILQPVTAAWLPNGLFFIVGFFMHLKANK